jgi:predicted PurR-regulated permease PerM
MDSQKKTFNLKSEFKILYIIIAIALLFLLKDVFMIGFLGILFCVILSFPVCFFAKWMPRGVAVLLTLLLSGAGTFGLVYLGSQPLAKQISQLDQTAPKALKKIRHWFKEQQDGVDSGQAPTPMMQPQAIAQKAEEKAEHLFEAVVENSGKMAIGFTEILSAIVVVIVLSAFFSHEPKSYQEGLLSLIPKEYDEDIKELWDRLALGLRHWVGGILISMIIMGVLTGLGLLVVGIQDWPLLALITFFATFIPYVGAISSAIPGLLLGLAQSTHFFFLAFLIYLGIHLIEGYVVEPLIMRRAVVIKPAYLLLWQLVMAAFGGILGIIVATPLLVCVKIMVGYLYTEKMLEKRAENT